MIKEFTEVERKGNEIEVGMGATGSYWTDCYPFEITKVISDKTIEIRELYTEMVKGTDYLDQKYNYFSNDNNVVIRVRKCKYGWKTSDDMKIQIGHARKYEDPIF